MNVGIRSQEYYLESLEEMIVLREGDPQGKGGYSQVCALVWFIFSD
jgi:hypothetical protein